MSANDARTGILLGYLPEDEQRDSTTAISCAGGPFSISSSVATCCPSTGSCRFPTTCLANTLWYTAGNQRCGPGRACATITIYESAENIDAQEATLYYHCRQTATESAYNTVYRENPVRAVESSPPKTSTQDGGSTSSSSNGDSPSSDSKAWIAGAVIGPLVFFLLCGLVYWTWRRRSSKHRQPQQSVEANETADKPELPGSTGTGTALAGSAADGWDKPEIGGAERYEAPGNDMAHTGPPRPELFGSEQTMPPGTTERHELQGSERFCQELPGASAGTNVEKNSSST